MFKRKSQNIRKNILLKLKEGNASYSQLERKINTGYRTIKNNCDELEDYGLVKIESEKKHPANGRKYHVISITKEGIDFLKKVKN